MSKNIIDLIEYKDNQEDIEGMVEDIPEEILDAYIKETENNTPDLWDRIEAGYDKEINLINSETKVRRKKTVGFIAAAALIIVVAIPIAIFNVTKDKDNRKEKSDTHLILKDSDSSDKYGDYSDAEEIASESIESDDAYEDNYIQNEDADEETYSDAEDAEGDNEYSYNANITEAASDDASLDNETNEAGATNNSVTQDIIVPDSQIADKITFNDITYVDAGEDLQTEKMEGYLYVEEIPNEFCSFPEDVLTVVWTGNEADAEYIYIRYNKLYKLYRKEK